MTIHLGLPLPAASSNQPGSTGGPPLTLPYLVLLLVGFTWHPASPSNPVSSYLTLSPLPAKAGGLLSVALSLGSPPLDVIQHHALWSPDFPPSRKTAVICSASTKNYGFVKCQSAVLPSSQALQRTFQVRLMTYSSCTLHIEHFTVPSKPKTS